MTRVRRAISILGGLAVGSASWLVGCEPESGRLDAASGATEVRTFVDRSVAYIGDPIGVSVEFVAPETVRVRALRSEPSADFEIDSVEALATERVAGRGLRHAWHVVMRPLSTGKQRLPALEIPIEAASDRGARGDARPAVVRAAAPLLEVRSIRDELEPREALFDIRPIPVRSKVRIYGIATLSAGLLAAIGFGMVMRRPRTREQFEAERERRGLLECLRALHAACGAGDEIPREMLASLESGFRAYLQHRHRLDAPGLTAAELVGHVPPAALCVTQKLVELRFGRSSDPERAHQVALELEQFLEADRAARSLEWSTGWGRRARRMRRA